MARGTGIGLAAGIVAGVAAFLIFGQKLATSHTITIANVDNMPGPAQKADGDPVTAGIPFIPAFKIPFSDPKVLYAYDPVFFKNPFTEPPL